MPILGRERPADLLIPDPEVSARHAEIRSLGNGTFLLRDLSSTNGTYVNGQRIESAVVSATDYVVLAGTPVDMNWLVSVMGGAARANPRDAQQPAVAPPAPEFRAPAPARVPQVQTVADSREMPVEPTLQDLKAPDPRMAAAQTQSRPSQREEPPRPAQPTAVPAPVAPTLEERLEPSISGRDAAPMTAPVVRCTRCGEPNPVQARYCSRCALPLGGTVVSSASAVQQAVARSGQPFAGFWLRLVAITIDGIILWIVNIALVAMMTGVRLMALADPGRLLYVLPRLAGGVIFFQILSAFIGFLYHTILESTPAQGSLGKMLLGIKVTDLSGRRISFGRAFGRNLGKILSTLTFMIGYLCAAFSSRKQALHDMMAGTLLWKRDHLERLEAESGT